MKYAIAIDLGGTHFRIALVSSAGKILKLNKTKTPKKPTEIVSLISDFIEQVDKKIIGIGVAIASPLNSKTGEVSWTKRLSYPKSFNLKKELEKKIKKPIFCENDLNATALGEAVFGSLKKVGNGVVITISTGIGGGLIINKKLYTGSNFLAGEVGHIPVDTKSKMKCNHGHIGDWEALSSALSVEKRYKEKTNKKKTAKEIVELAKSGDKISKKILKETSKYIGIGLSGVINILDPEVVVIYGSFFLKIWPIYNKEIKKYLFMRAFNKKVRFVKTKLGDNGGLLGVASLVFKA